MYPALQQVDVHEEQLIVQLLHLERQRPDEPEGLLEVLHVEEQGGEPQLHAMPEKRALLLFRPRHLLLAQIHLQLIEPGHDGEDVDDVAHDLGRLRLGHHREERAQLGEERLEGGGILEPRQEFGQLLDGLFLHLHALAVRSSRAENHLPVRGDSLLGLRRFQFRG